MRTTKRMTRVPRKLQECSKDEISRECRGEEDRSLIFVGVGREFQMPLTRKDGVKATWDFRYPKAVALNSFVPALSETCNCSLNMRGRQESRLSTTSFLLHLDERKEHPRYLSYHKASLTPNPRHRRNNKMTRSFLYALLYL